MHFSLIHQFQTFAVWHLSNQLNFNLDFITFGQTYKSNDIINPALDINNIVPRGIEWFKTLIKEYPKILLSFLSTIKLFYSKLEINIKIGIMKEDNFISSYPNSSSHPLNWYFCTNGSANGSFQKHYWAFFACRRSYNDLSTYLVVVG